jgi:hypothetical protein
MEIFWQEGGGGDGAEVTYMMFDGTVPANGTASALTGDIVGVYVDPTTLPPVISDPTANTGTIVDAGTTHTLSVTATGATTYQWQFNNVDIPGATGPEYTITDADPTDSGQYTVFVGNENSTVRSVLMNIVVTATGVFNIEAEDYDYDSGQHQAAASVMPYLGGAYEGLAAVFDVDYHSTESLAATDWTPIYRTGPPVTAGTQSPFGAEQPGGQFAITRMGEFELTDNYKIGWVGAGDWGNYTRTFPTPAQEYWVFVGSSFDGTADGQIDQSLGLVTAGVGTTTQTVQPLGNFSGPGTGGWSRNNLVALTDDAGAIATVELGGLNTIRWSYDSGDVDYLVFVPATPGGGGDGPQITDVSITGTDLTVTWTGGGQAETATSIDGPWTPTGDSDGSYTATVTSTGNAFVRINAPAAE